MPARPVGPPARARTAAEREAGRQWASASFVGARHTFPCQAAVGDLEAIRRSLRARLSAVEWRLPGHIVADIAVESDDSGRGLRIEVLTVED